jgi:molybdopterin/thiamine biosynthesis adenylyltransferase
VYDPDEDHPNTLPVTVRGDWLLNTPLVTPRPETTDSAINQNRYDRNIRAITARGQQQLAETHIGLVGVGGLGTIKAEEFARYGIGELTIVDPDIVEESNLPRLFGAYDHHLDRPKVEVMKEHLYRCNPDITVNAVQAPAEDAADALKQCDLLVAGVDQISARMWLNQFAVRHLIPYVDAGVVIDTEDEDTIEAMEGYIQVIAPGATACFDCMDRGDPEQARIESLSDEALQEEVKRGYIDETSLSPEPAVVPLNGVIASKTVQTVAKLVTGYYAPAGFLRFEGIDNTLETVTIRPRATCQTCGDNGTLGRGDRDATAAEFDATQIDIDTAALEAEIGTDDEPSAGEAGSPLDSLPEDSNGFPGQNEA